MEYCVLRCGAGVSGVDLKKSFDDFLMFISIWYRPLKIGLLKICKVNSNPHSGKRFRIRPLQKPLKYSSARHVCITNRLKSIFMS